MSFCLDNEKLLEKYKTILTKIEHLKRIKLKALPVYDWFWLPVYHCHYWFFYHGLKFQDSVCNGCPYLTMLSVNVRDIAIITVKNVNYRCIIHFISKSGAINISKSYVLEDPGYI